MSLLDTILIELYADKQELFKKISGSIAATQSVSL